MRADLKERLDTLEANATSRDQVVDRALEFIHRRQSDIEAGQRALQAKVDEHEKQLNVGETVLAELRSFRGDFSAAAQLLARLFPTTPRV